VWTGAIPGNKGKAVRVGLWAHGGKVLIFIGARYSLRDAPHESASCAAHVVRFSQD
jgi:hypothetical protein